MPVNPRSTFQIAGHPLHPLLVPLPIALLVSAFACDLFFWATGSGGWATAALWLIGAGILMGAGAAIGGLTDFLGEPRIRDLRDAWHHLFGNAAAIVVSIVNFFVRYGDPAGGVFPWGFWLSLIVVLLLVYSGWKGGELVFRHRVAVLDNEIR
jgi:uncharacterized membrane protein